MAWKLALVTMESVREVLINPGLTGEITLRNRRTSVTPQLSWEKSLPAKEYGQRVSN